MKKHRRPQTFSQLLSNVPVENLQEKKEAGGVKRGRRGKARKDRIENDGKEYEVEVRRIGTGYRIYQEEVGKRSLDVGYADRKVVSRPEGVEALVEGKNMSVVIKANEERRKKPREVVKMVVMNTVAAREKVRPASAYTGSGVVRADRVGKMKLKSTKSTL